MSCVLKLSRDLGLNTEEGDPEIRFLPFFALSAVMSNFELLRAVKWVRSRNGLNKLELPI